MNRSKKILLIACLGASLLTSFASTARADDDGWGRVGLNLFLGGPAYYNPPPVYYPPPAYYAPPPPPQPAYGYYGAQGPAYYAPPQAYYGDRGGWRGGDGWRGRGRWGRGDDD